MLATHTKTHRFGIGLPADIVAIFSFTSSSVDTCRDTHTETAQMQIKSSNAGLDPADTRIKDDRSGEVVKCAALV